MSVRVAVTYCYCERGHGLTDEENEREGHGDLPMRKMSAKDMGDSPMRKMRAKDMGTYR